ncbi:MAG: putative toxin-antitoxin system toxin component, PIN family [Acidobacteriota bacterium]
MFEQVVNDHELFLSPFILEEFERVMSVKIRFHRDRVLRAVALLERKGRVLEPGPLEEPVCRDPDDDQVSALAGEGEADVLVTGDDDLLVLEFFEDIPIISPREFLTFNRR